MKAQFVIVSKARKQVLDFKDETDSVNPHFNHIIDISNHPQKDEIDTDWFYDEETNCFSAEGEIYYPEVEPEPESDEPTQLDRMEESLKEISENSINWDSMATAITEGVNGI